MACFKGRLIRDARFYKQLRLRGRLHTPNDSRIEWRCDSEARTALLAWVRRAFLCATYRE